MESFLSVRYWLGWLLLLVASNTAATALPDPFVAVYELERSGIKAGEVRLSLKPIAKNRYQYRRTSKTTGLINLISPQSIDEFSELEATETRIRPTRYLYNRQGRKNRLVQINFDWEKMQATNRIDGDHWVMGIPARTWDKLAVELAVVMDLRATGQTSNYAVADGGKLKSYQFEKIGEERLETAAGAYDTIIIRRKRSEDSKRSTRLWMAPALNFVPVHVVHENQGEGEGEVNLISFEQP